MIVLTTPTGRIGSATLDRVLSAGAPVRVIARQPDRIADDVRDRIEVIEGSHDDAEVLAAALRGADGLFWLVPPDFGADPSAQYQRFTRALTQNLNGHPTHVVAVSSLGYGYGKNAGLLSPAWEMEDAIAATGVPLRSLRLPFFMENLLAQTEPIKHQGLISMANARDHHLATVATSDAATVAADLLLDQTWADQEGVPVVGDRLTPTAMAAAIAEALGREVRLNQITRRQLETTLSDHGAGQDWAKGMAEMVAAQDDGVYDLERNESPLDSPTDFRTWCAETLVPTVNGK